MAYNKLAFVVCVCVVGGGGGLLGQQAALFGTATL